MQLKTKLKTKDFIWHWGTFQSRAVNAEFQPALFLYAEVSGKMRMRQYETRYYRVWGTHLSERSNTQTFFPKIYWSESESTTRRSSC